MSGDLCLKVCLNCFTMTKEFNLDCCIMWLNQSDSDLNSVAERSRSIPSVNRKSSCGRKISIESAW